MLTRKLRTIELKLEDLAELEAAKAKCQAGLGHRAPQDRTPGEPLDLAARTKQMVEARIGYNPKPRRCM